MARKHWPWTLTLALTLSCAPKPNNHNSNLSAPAVPARQARFAVHDGAIIRGPVAEKRIALVFTGHDFAEAVDTVLAELSRHNGHGSFFFTGDFLRHPDFAPLVQKVIRNGHYLGPHSDKHLLYCSWDQDKKSLVTAAQFRTDLEENLNALRRFGIPRSRITFFLPPYEHHNQHVADWTREMGLTLINFTPGTRSAADYTGEAETNFVASSAIFDSILAREQQDANGLNGYILLLHAGAGPVRADKFHKRFGALLDLLSQKGYEFVRIDELLAKGG